LHTNADSILNILVVILFIARNMNWYMLLKYSFIATKPVEDIPNDFEHMILLGGAVRPVLQDRIILLLR
jgi:hypothetical protein